MIFTIDRINAILRAEGMPRCEDFTRPMRSISREAQACGALERKYRMSGLDLEHLRFGMKDGQRVRMLLGERVICLERHAELNRGFVPPSARYITAMVDVATDRVEYHIDADPPWDMGIDVPVDRFETNRGEFVDMPRYPNGKE